MKKEYVRLLLSLIVIFIILINVILYLAWPLLTGTTVVLATRPVDPFDILRGQYITIRYEISSIPSISGAIEGETVYVSLREDNTGIWRYEGRSLTKPTKGAFIKGDIKRTTGENAFVEYGIEQYFFERGATIPQTNLTIEVKLSSSGHARISQLLQHGKPLEIQYEEKGLAS